MVQLLVLGGYGGVGRHLCRLLLAHTDVNLVIAGRNEQKAASLASDLEKAYPGGRVSFSRVDAADPKSLQTGFKGVDFVLVAATTPQFAASVADAALQENCHYLDIYFEPAVNTQLQPLSDEIEACSRCFVTQAGFHPGLAAVFVRRAADYFDQMDHASVAFTMNAQIERPESAYELVDALVDFHAEVFREGAWRPAGYRDSIKVDYGGQFGVRMSVPFDLPEVRPLPQSLGLKSLGVYTTGFNAFVDYLVYPLMSLSQKIKPGALRHFWATALVFGINRFSPAEPGVVFMVQAEGLANGIRRKVTITSRHPDAYAFTAIPVVACIRQILDGSTAEPGLHMMGHLVDPVRLITDMQQMGVEVDTETEPPNGN